MENLNLIPSESIIAKIYFIRGKKVMLDRDLAELYQVEKRVLIQAVNRNIERFPDDFMFQLQPSEATALKSQIVISKVGRGGDRYNPYVFTEQGVAMLSSVLRSPRAIQVNIEIIRTFTKLREILADNKKLAEKIEKMERKYDKYIFDIFEAIKLLRVQKDESRPKEKIGFKITN